MRIEAFHSQDLGELVRVWNRNLPADPISPARLERMTGRGVSGVFHARVALLLFFLSYKVDSPATDNQPQNQGYNYPKSHCSG